MKRKIATEVWQELLTQLKKERGIKTDTQLAQFLGVPRATMGDWMRGESASKDVELIESVKGLLIGGGEKGVRASEEEFPKSLAEEELFFRLIEGTINNLLPVLRFLTKEGQISLRKKLRVRFGTVKWVEFTRLVTALIGEDSYEQVRANFPEFFGEEGGKANGE